MLDEFERKVVWELVKLYERDLPNADKDEYSALCFWHCSGFPAADRLPPSIRDLAIKNLFALPAAVAVQCALRGWL